MYDERVPTVLAVAYGGGHIACLLPVVQRLRAQGWRVELLALTTAAAYCAERRVAHSRFVDFPLVQDARSRAHGLRLAAVQSGHPTVAVEETIAYLGASYRDLEDALGVDGAAQRFAAVGRQAFLPQASLARIIAAVRPEVVLVTSAPRAERAAVHAARAAGIPTVVVVDLFALGDEALLADPQYGDRICVFAESVRGRLVATGRAADEVIVTGNPVFDRLADPGLREAGMALRQARGWEGRQVITWASQPEPADPELPRRIESALIAATLQHPTWQLVLRPHPSDQVTFAEHGPRVVISSRADDLHTLLAASDVIVTMTSTVGLEGVLLGKPLVTWDRSQNTRYCPYAAMGFARGIDELKDVPQVLAAALAGDAPRPELPSLGHGTAAVATLVQQLARICK